MKEEFTVKEVVSILGIPRPRLQDWVLRGFVKPSLVCSAGQGVANIYGRIDLYVISIFKTLVEHGIHRAEAKEMARLLEIEIGARLLEYEKYEGNMFLAFFKRPELGAEAKRSTKTLESPFVRIIRDRDTAKSFSSLFLADPHGGFSLALVLDFRALKSSVDRKIEG